MASPLPSSGGPLSNIHLPTTRSFCHWLARFFPFCFCWRGFLSVCGFFGKFLSTCFGVISTSVCRYLSFVGVVLVADIRKIVGSVCEFGVPHLLKGFPVFMAWLFGWCYLHHCLFAFFLPLWLYWVIKEEFSWPIFQGECVCVCVKEYVFECIISAKRGKFLNGLNNSKAS